MSEEKKDGENRLQGITVQVDDAVSQGHYANFAVINHSPGEFILDFIFVQPGQPRAKVLDRIILSPTNAMRLSEALQENLLRYEKRFGEIKVATVKPSDLVVN